MAVPRGTIGRKVSGFMLEVEGIGLFCGRIHLQTRENKGNQRESKKTKRTQGKTKGDQGEPRKNEVK